MKYNDRIDEINGNKTESIKDVISIIKANPNKKLDFVIYRNNNFVNLEITPKQVLNEKGEKTGVIGIQFSRERKKIGFFSAINDSIVNCLVIIKKTLIAFIEIIFGKRDHCEVEVLF